MKDRSKTIGNVVVFIAALVLIATFRSQSSVTVTFEDDLIVFNGPNEYHYSVSYHDIEQVESANYDDMGEVVSGDQTRQAAWGTWKNSAWGEYTLCVTKKIDNAVLLTLTDGQHVVFNIEDEDVTKAMVQTLLDYQAHLSETGALPNE